MREILKRAPGGVNGVRLIALVLLVLAAAAVRKPLLGFLYHHRVWAEPTLAESLAEAGVDVRLDFRFTLGDIAFLNSLDDAAIPPEHPWRRVDVEVDGTVYPVEATRFRNYFKYLRIQDPARSFSLRFPKKHPLDGVRAYDVFRVEGLDLLDWRLSRMLAAELGVITPRARCAGMSLHGIDQGIVLFKQAYDEVFLARNGMEDGVIFTAERNGGEEWRITWILENDKTTHAEHRRRHVKRFLDAAARRDPHAAEKFFDPGYMARFEVLRELLDADPGLVLEDNTVIVYNTRNGLFYPVFDEASLQNRNRGNRSGDFLFVLERLERWELFGEKREERRRMMGLKLNDLLARHARYCSWHGGESARGAGRWRERWRKYLVQSFFDYHVFPLIRKFAEEENSGDNNRRRTLKRSPYKAEAGSMREGLNWCLGEAAMSAEDFVKEYKELRLSLVSGRRAIVRAGTYELKRNVIVPGECALEIQPGTKLRLAPGVSLVSFGPVHAQGREEAPIIVEPLNPGQAFGTLAVRLTEEQDCFFEHVHISGASGASVLGAFYPGGLSLCGAKGEIRFCRFTGNGGDAAVAMINGRAAIHHCFFTGNRGDDIRLTGVKGAVNDNRFEAGAALAERDPGLFAADSPETRDALVMSRSEVFVSNNVFSFYPGKGLTAGEESVCLARGNRFLNNLTGMAARNGARLFAEGNLFSRNQRAVRAYMKDGFYGGGAVMLLENRWSGNTRPVRSDKHSTVINVGSPNRWSGRLDDLLKRSGGGGLGGVNRLATDFTREGTRVKSFTVGLGLSRVDERNRIILVSLPPGAGTRQPVYFELSEPGARLSLQPALHGGEQNNPGESPLIPLANGQVHDFGAWIYYGDVAVEGQGAPIQYELFVTTGSLPMVEIDTTGEQGFATPIKDEPRIPCKVRVLSNPADPSWNGDYDGRFLDAEIEGRGKKFPKWKYGLQFDSARGFGGMPEGRNWVLESSFVEKSLMRSRLAYWLLDRITKAGNPSVAVPDGRFVEVFLNGAYQGVYVWMQHVDREFLELRGFNPMRQDNAVLYRGRNENADFSPFNREREEYKKDYKYLSGGEQPGEKSKDPIWGWRSGFEQRHPDPDRFGEYWTPLEELTRFTAASSDKEFQAHIFNTYLNRENFMNVWIFTQLADDSDGLSKNRYLARRRGVGEKWFIIPWDKDGVMGRMYSMNRRGPDHWLTSYLFDRCWKDPNFRGDFVRRWRALRGSGVISGEAILAEINKWTELLADPQQRNFRVWPPDSYLYPDAATFHQEVDYLKEWLIRRIQFLDRYLTQVEAPTAPAAGRS